MKRNISYITLFSASLGLLAGCVSGRQAGKGISVTPVPYVLAPDSANRVRMDLCFHVPEDYLSKRSRLVITPQLVVEDTVRDEYLPLVVDAPIYGKKKERMEKLSGYTDPYAGRAQRAGKASRPLELPYNETVQLPEGTDNARIVAVVSTDGCGECTGVDTIEVAAVSNPVTLMPEVREALVLNWIEPEFVIRPKVMEGKGVANLQFAINRHGIDLAMGNNRAELENMVNTLAPVLNDSLATVNSLDIYGMASADGSLAFNTALARNRAESARKWLVNRLAIRPEVQRLMSVGSRPEGWQPVLDAMTADGNPDSVAVKAILEKYADGNDDVQERHIRRLPCWNQVKTKYLQKDRKVEYVYTYTIRSFTSDAELLEMYGKRPDAFNEDELLRVAALAGTHDRKKEVYTTILKYFPQSHVAANNLAVLYLREGNEGKALEILDNLKEHSVETLNTLAASYVYKADYERAVELLQDVDLPEARYNLGLLKARQRKLREAYELLRPFGDLKSAISALSVNENGDAKRMLDALDVHTPVAEYARSLVFARTKDTGSFYKHIGNACGDDKLRRRAATEPDFYPYREEEAFRKLTDKR